MLDIGILTVPAYTKMEKEIGEGNYVNKSQRES
jgi:hypothetical protein